MLRAIALANDCSLSAHMDEAAIRKKYPKEWKKKGLKNSKRIYKCLKAKGLIYIAKKRPIKWSLTPLGLKLASKMNFCKKR